MKVHVGNEIRRDDKNAFARRENRYEKKFGHRVGICRRGIDEVDKFLDSSFRLVRMRIHVRPCEDFT